MDDVVTSTFRRSKYYPDIAAIFVFVILITCFIPVGSIFGLTTSPANSELFAIDRYF